jgi:hypothetical protein
VKAGVEAVSSAALKPVTDLINAIFGPAAEEAGQMLKDHVRVFRAERQLLLYERTAKKFEKSGVRPQKVPLKLLFPIVENASIEEDDDLHNRWANLLAHAADPAQAETVNISFTTILRELTPRQVKFLDALYDEAQRRAEHRLSHVIESINFGYADFILVFTDAGLSRYPSRQGYTMAESGRDDVKADTRERGVALDMFVRHRIMEEIYEIPPNRSQSPSWEPEIDSGFQFTLLGAQFVAACREPHID